MYAHLTILTALAALAVALPAPVTAPAVVPGQDYAASSTTTDAKIKTKGRQIGDLLGDVGKLVDNITGDALSGAGDIIDGVTGGAGTGSAAGASATGASAAGGAGAGDALVCLMISFPRPFDP